MCVVDSCESYTIYLFLKLGSGKAFSQVCRSMDITIELSGVYVCAGGHAPDVCGQAPEVVAS